ncbi:MAG: hypothetical protein ABI894_06070 [Ilumatobacteraceae bacterium]
MVECESLVALSADSDGITFRVILDVGDTALHLIGANETGQHIPLVVLTTDAQILALDSVSVTQFSMGGGQPPVAEITLQAQGVRFV